MRRQWIHHSRAAPAPRAGRCTMPRSLDHVDSHRRSRNRTGKVEGGESGSPQCVQRVMFKYSLSILNITLHTAAIILKWCQGLKIWEQCKLRFQFPVNKKILCSHWEFKSIRWQYIKNKCNSSLSYIGPTFVARFGVNFINTLQHVIVIACFSAWDLLFFLASLLHFKVLMVRSPNQNHTKLITVVLSNKTPPNQSACVKNKLN